MLLIMSLGVLTDFDPHLVYILLEFPPRALRFDEVLLVVRGLQPDIVEHLQFLIQCEQRGLHALDLYVSFAQLKLEGLGLLLKL